MSIGYMNAPQELHEADGDIPSRNLATEGNILTKTIIFPIELAELIVVLMEDNTEECVLSVKVQALGRDTPGPVVATLTIPSDAKKGSVIRNNLSGSSKPAVRANIGDKVLVDVTTPGTAQAEVFGMLRRSQQPPPLAGVYGYYEVNQ